MIDLVERLRYWPKLTPIDRKAAADEIERLTMAVKISDTIIKELMVDNERLRAALREYGEHHHQCPVSAGAVDSHCDCGLRAALEGKP